MQRAAQIPVNNELMINYGTEEQIEQRRQILVQKVLAKMSIVNFE